MSEQPSSVGDAPVVGAKVIRPRFPRHGEGDGPRRPVIEIVSSEIPRMIRQTIAALAAHDDNLYTQAGELVTITRQPDHVAPTCPGREDVTEPCDTCQVEAGEECGRDKRKGSSILSRAGTPMVSPIGSSLIERCAEVAVWRKWDKTGGEKVGKQKPPGEWVDAAPDGTVLRAVEGRKHFPGVRPFRAIIETPGIAPSGRVISEPGYDKETSLFHLPAFEMDPIPDEPTQAESAECMSYLWRHMYGDFPFADVGESSPFDVDRHDQYKRALAVPGAFVGLASTLTVLARPAILGAVPGFVFEAAGQGSGKTMQVHLTALLTTGRAGSLMTFPMKAGDPNEEELEKVLGGYALAGSRIVAFDNICGNLGGPALDKVLTAIDTISIRILGELKTVTVPWIGTALFSGNNLTMTSDVARRSMVSRLVSSHESPSKRPASDFLHPRLLAWTRANLPKLVRCALVILRAFWVAKDKPHAGERGGFEEWCSIIPGAIMYAGGPNVIKAWAEEEMAASGGDETATAHGTLLAMWPFDQAVKAGEVLSHAFKNEFEILRGTLPPDGLDDLREAIRTICKCPDRVPKASPFGKALAKLRDKIRNGATLSHRMDGKGIALWSVIRHERRGQAPQAPPPVPAPVVEPVATPLPAAVVICEACGRGRGGGPGQCDPCGVCFGCLDVDRGGCAECRCEAG